MPARWSSFAVGVVVGSTATCLLLRRNVTTSSAARTRPAPIRDAGDLADDDCVELCVKTLLEVVDSGAKNMEVVVLKIAEDGTRSETTLPDEALDAMCARIEREREEGKDEGKDEMKD